jgi:hypothetical protein
LHRENKLPKKIETDITDCFFCSMVVSFFMYRRNIGIAQGLSCNCLYIYNIHFCFVLGSKWCRLCYFSMYFGFWFEIVYCFNWFLIYYESFYCSLE